MKIARWHYVLVGVWVLFFSACQTGVAPVSPHLAQETVSQDLLMQSLLKRQSDIKTLRAFVQTSIEKDGTKQSVRQAIVLCGGESIRVDTFSFFGQILWVFLHNSGETVLYDSANNHVYRGPEVAGVVEQVVGVAVDFKEIIEVFSGNIPRLKNHRINRAFLDRENNLYQLETVDATGRERFEISMDAISLLPMKWVKLQNSHRPYTVTWSDYKPVEDREFPHHVAIENIERQERLVVNYQSPKINMALSADAFELPGFTKAPKVCRWEGKSGGSSIVEKAVTQ